MVEFNARFCVLAQKANYKSTDNPALCGMFRCKLHFCLQNAWTSPGTPEIQFFNVRAVFDHAVNIEHTLNEIDMRHHQTQGPLNIIRNPAKAASVKATTCHSGA
jgi:hypothetical protein